MENDELISFTLNNFKFKYRLNGNLIRSFNSNLDPVDNCPVIEDFGDIYPYLALYGNNDTCKNEILEVLNSSKIYNNLYIEKNGLLNLFHNHDWLFTFSEMYSVTNDDFYLKNLKKSLLEIQRLTTASNFVILDYYKVRRQNTINRKLLFKSANPFNMGFYEIFFEYMTLSGDYCFLDFLEKTVKSTLNLYVTKKNHLFSRNFTSKSSLINEFLLFFSSYQARLFKDNTNAIFGLLSLKSFERFDFLKLVIENWYNAMCSNFLIDDGRVYNYSNDNSSDNLKSSFSLIDVLLELKEIIGLDKLSNSINNIIKYQLSSKLANGLFPESKSSRAAHLDANVDFCVSLYKSSIFLNNKKYYNEFISLKKSILDAFKTENGFVLYVDGSNRIIDDRIIVKYQSLILKLTLIPNTFKKISQFNYDLLKDR